MEYPVEIEPDGDRWMVYFPDIPEALTDGKNKSEALEMAHDALMTAFEFYVEENIPIPKPSKARKGQCVIQLNASLTAKILLLNEMFRQEVRAVDLARRIETSPQEFSRFTDLHHKTKINNLEKAINALGKRLDIRIK